MRLKKIKIVLDLTTNEATLLADIDGVVTQGMRLCSNGEVEYFPGILADYFSERSLNFTHCENLPHPANITLTFTSFEQGWVKELASYVESIAND